MKTKKTQCHPLDKATGPAARRPLRDLGGVGLSNCHSREGGNPQVPGFRLKAGMTVLGRGFTLIELMIVVVILGLLATVVMPRILNRPEQARRMKAKVDIRNIESALALFKTDTGRFPTTSEGLQVLVTDPGIRGYNSDGYLDKVPQDPWGSVYIYVSPGVHSKDYDLESYGKDGEDGGVNDDADIESWNLDEVG